MKPFAVRSGQVEVFNTSVILPVSIVTPVDTSQLLNMFYCVSVLFWCIDPGPPSHLTFDSPSETEITLHWEAPHKPNGVLTGYVLQYHESESHDLLCHSIRYSVTQPKHF